MKQKFTLLALLSVALLFSSSCKRSAQSYSNDNPAYVIYNSSGKKVSFNEMVKSLSSADITLFGELHNDPISHWLELELVKKLYEIKEEGFVVGAEMWEADNQLVLDEMLKNKWIDMKAYQENSVLWSNFNTDYRPILHFAQEKEIPFVATNVPRRYARIVSKRGDEALDSLSAQAQEYIAPLPIHMDMQDKFYTKIADIFKETLGGHTQSGTSITNIVKAQMVKDATMAHFIVNNLPKGGHLFHFHGELHSAFNSGIGYYIKHYNSKLKYKTISVVKMENPLEFKAKESRANFNIVVPENMTVTHDN
ncbi:MAG: ChaN family lipoprotein [Bacteroidales bacterium]